MQIDITIIGNYREIPVGGFLHIDNSDCRKPSKEAEKEEEPQNSYGEVPMTDGDEEVPDIEESLSSSNRGEIQKNIKRSRIVDLR